MAMDTTQIDFEEDVNEDWGWPTEDQDDQPSPILPPQLHPAVSLGMQRVSSCYFSMPSDSSETTNSVADLLSVLDSTEENTSQNESWGRSSKDVLYHDIMMHVFTFLNVCDLRSYSETARRPNFECYYFLQLYLQRAIIPGQTNASVDQVWTLSGAGIVSRLSQSHPDEAERIVQTYLDSNSTLRNMPLSHSLSYIRHVLRQNGFLQHVSSGSSPSHALASAALLITLMGAASHYMGDSGTSTTEMAQTALRVGLAGSAIMGAATKMSERQEHEQEQQQRSNLTMRETAEQMASLIQEIPLRMLRQLNRFGRQDSPTTSLMHFPSSVASAMYAVFTSAYDHSLSNNTTSTIDTTVKASGQNFDESYPLTPNPYEHIEEKKDDEIPTKLPKAEVAHTDKSLLNPKQSRKGATGCVGAYARAVRNAKDCLCTHVREQRRSNFAALSLAEQTDLSAAFLDACSSDHSLDIVKDFVQRRLLIDVNTFFTGADGVDTCALHTASFHGASAVVAFLCQGLDDHDPSKDGGLADVNIRDSNGWTALHFAAGADAVSVVHVLAAHRTCKLVVEANNGYTPFHWAQRLSNDDVAEELRKLGADQRFQLEFRKELTAMAERFFNSMMTGANTVTTTAAQ